MDIKKKNFFKNIVLFLMFLSLLLSCTNKPSTIQKEAEGEHNVELPEQQEDIALTDDEVILYFETFKELLLKGNIEELAGLVYFPVEGDYNRKITNEAGEPGFEFNFYRNKEDFIESYSELFGEDLINLLKIVDFSKSLQKDYDVTIKKKPNIEITFSVGFINWFEPDKKPTMAIFNVNYDETDCDVCGSGIIYRFEKIDGNIKLTSIQFVG